MSERATRRHRLLDDERASDTEREHVIDLLQRAVGQGILDLDEFGERTDAVLAATGRAELNAVLRDLPDRLVESAQTTDVLVLRSMLSEVRRSGPWVVPPRLLISSRLGATRLDFTEARLPGQRVSVQLAVTGGLIELRVPRKATVLTAGVRVTGGRVVDRRCPSRRDARRGPKAPEFELGGRLLAGEVRIVRPRAFRLRRH